MARRATSLGPKPSSFLGFVVFLLFVLANSLGPRPFFSIFLFLFSFFVWFSKDKSLFFRYTKDVFASLLGVYLAQPFFTTSFVSLSLCLLIFCLSFLLSFFASLFSFLSLLPSFLCFLLHVSGFLYFLFVGKLT